MKKRRLLIVVLGLVVALCACGKNGANNQNNQGHGNNVQNNQQDNVHNNATEQEKKEYLINFGKRVKFYREKLGMTQKELGIKAGYVDGTNPASSVYKIENGQIDVTQSKLLDLAKALQIEPYELIVSPQVSRMMKYAEGIIEMQKGENHVEG